jgi:hypothetical protein
LGRWVNYFSFWLSPDLCAASSSSEQDAFACPGSIRRQSLRQSAESYSSALKKLTVGPIP